MWPRKSQEQKQETQKYQQILIDGYRDDLQAAAAEQDPIARLRMYAEAQKTASVWRDTERRVVKKKADKHGKAAFLGIEAGSLPLMMLAMSAVGFPGIAVFLAGLGVAAYAQYKVEKHKGKENADFIEGLSQKNLEALEGVRDTLRVRWDEIVLRREEIESLKREYSAVRNLFNTIAGEKAVIAPLPVAAPKKQKPWGTLPKGYTPPAQ